MNIEKNDAPEYPVGERIKYFRTQKGISTNKLANLSGISQSYLRDVELQNKNPSVEIVHLLCKALGITLSQFFDDGSQNLLNNDPLVQRIYQLNSKQREALLAFLNTIS
jgi:transcriptional regulator with XRE-family HTH domain